MFKKVLLALALGFSGTALADVPPADMVLTGQIGRNMEPAVDYLRVLAKKKTNIVIVLDSPGGSVHAGWHFINAMRAAQAKGVTLECHVSGMAASMAFQILAECDRRYAMEYSFLLWHPVRASVRGALLPKQAIVLAKLLTQMSRRLVSDLRKRFVVKDKYFWFHFRAETFHLASDVAPKSNGFITILSQTPEIDKSTRTFANSPYGLRGYMGFQYIHPRALEMYQSN